MEREVLVGRLRQALNEGDARRVRRLLHRSAVLVLDTGDRSGGSAIGRRAAAEALIGIRDADAAFEPASVNGRPGMVLRSRTGDALGVIALDSGRGRIRELWATLAPEKLVSWQTGPQRS